MIQIVNYEPNHAAPFKELNEEWILRYFEMEEVDRNMLSNPQTAILDKGGAILIALDGNEPVGTCALLNKGEKIYELAKMAVAPKAQGKQIGYLLGVRTLEKARELSARKVYLETNSQLTPAINLYQKLGFEEIQGGCSPYARCDVRMEKNL